MKNRYIRFKISLMKNYLFVVFVVFFYSVNFGQNATFNPEKYYTTKDSVQLSSFEEDIAYVLKDDFNDVVRNHPEFFVEFPTDPDNTYVKNSDEQFMSEVGQDNYYIYYAYFLRQLYKDENFEEQRNRLMYIYCRLNKMSSLLEGGGSGFAHLYARIHGYTEYSIYLYYLTKNDFSVKHDITKQKDLFRQTLQQVVTDRLDNEYFDDEMRKSDLKEEIFELIDKIYSDITDLFYLTQAQKFYYSNYATW